MITRDENPAPFCKCGCGERVKWSSNKKNWNEYVNYHKARERMLNNNPMKDPKVKEKHLLKIRSAENMERLSIHNPMQRPEMRKWFSENNPSSKLKNRLKKVGENNPMKRPEVIEKHQKSMINLMGKNHWNWKHGSSFEPYCEIWVDKDYKNSIKERDNNKCQNPYCRHKNDSNLMVHHVNYDKKCCHPWNLITICGSCHSRSNFNRNFWKKLYANIIKKKNKK